VTHLRLDETHEPLESSQAIIEDDVTLTVDGQQPQHPDRVPSAASREVLHLPDAIPRKADTRSSIVDRFDVLIRYDDSSRRPPAWPRHDPQDRPDQQGRRRQQAIDAAPRSPPDDRGTRQADAHPRT
jgi:hypothetical protein